MKRKTTLFALLIVLVAGGVAIAAWYFSRRSQILPLPELSLSGVDSAVALAIEQELEHARSQPRSGEARGKLALVLLAHQFTVEGVTCLVQAEQLEPDNPSWPYLLALMDQAATMSQTDQRLRRALALSDAKHPNDQTIRLRLVEHLLSNNELDEAERELATAERLNENENDTPRLRYYRGLLACRRQQWRSAYAALLPLSEVREVRQRVAAQLAVICQQLGKTEEASQFAQRAARGEDPAWTDRYVRTFASIELGRRARFREVADHEQARNTPQALQSLQQLLHESGGRDPLVHFSIARNYSQAGRLEQAEKHFRDAVELAPRQFRYQYHLGLTLLSLAEKDNQMGLADRASRRTKEATAVAALAVELNPHDGFGQLLLGRCLVAQGRWADALPVLSNAERLRPEVAGVHLLLGETLAQLGKQQDALAHLLRAVELAPADPHTTEALQRHRRKWDEKK